MTANLSKYLTLTIGAFLVTWIAPPASAATTVAEGSGPTTLSITLGAGVTFTGVSYTGAGSVSFTTTAITYTPPDDFTGQSDITTGEDVTYTLSDSSTATEIITVTAVNDAPVAVDDSESPIPSKVASLLQTKRASRGGSGAPSRGQSSIGPGRLPPVASLVSGKSKSRGRGK